MTTDKQKTALIIGATGGVGGEAARALLKRGWRVRALRRQASGKDRPDLAGIEWVKGDAMRAGDVLAAGAGAQVIVHGANPPGYRNWQGTVVPMIENTIAAAKAAGATIVFPGTVYNFGPDAFPVLAETSPQNPRTRKGALRVAMEQRLAAAAADGVQTIIVRCGDFFGPRAGNNWFAQGLIKPGKPVKSVTYPGAPDIGHAWAYLPDVGETIARLVEARDRLEPFAVFHMRGEWLPEGGEMAEVHPPRGRRFSPADPPAAVAAGQARRALQRDVPRDARDALPLA